jgi:hypothetical protein
MSGNPFKHLFRLPGFNEQSFVGESGLNYEHVKELGFEECKEGTGGFVVYRKPNDIGGYDYLPFVDRWYPGNMPIVNPEADRWLEGYERGIVLFVMGEAQNRQYVRHSADGSVSTHPPATV